jgi:CcmD family protein
MATFIAAYVIVWVAMAFYVVRLRRNQQRLERLMRTLEASAQAAPAWVETGSPSDAGA